MPTTIDIIRTIAGLALPVRCVLVQGLYVGSCSYTDLCKNLINEIAGITADNCLPDWRRYHRCILSFRWHVRVQAAPSLAFLDNFPIEEERTKVESDRYIECQCLWKKTKKTLQIQRRNRRRKKSNHTKTLLNNYTIK